MSIETLNEFEEENRTKIISIMLCDEGDRLERLNEGRAGVVFRIDKGDRHFPRFICAKCPRFRKFPTPEMTIEAISNSLREIKKSYAVFNSPWVQKYFDVKLVCNWPFLLSQYREGTLRDVIDGTIQAGTVDRLGVLLQVVRGLKHCYSVGLSSHQDLKPENIFLDNLRRRYPDQDMGILGLKAYISDFGLADAFRDFGKKDASRPYMPTEQYASNELLIESGSALDVFAFGVIAHELLHEAGEHPIGQKTTEVWPWEAGRDIPRRWDRERTWREWAGSEKKPMRLTHASGELSEIVFCCLEADPQKRPSLDLLERALISSIRYFGGYSEEIIRQQLAAVEDPYSSDNEWPYVQQRIEAVERALREAL